jgi:hypothetical protein
MARTTKAQQEEIEHAKTNLRAILPPGSTIYTVLKSVARSGMSRHIAVYAIVNGEPQSINWETAKVLGYTRSDDGSLKVSGGGMDMGFHLAYSLSRSLYNGSFECIGKGCPSNDHSNGDRNYTPHAHSDGGYALNHRWM